MISFNKFSLHACTDNKELVSNSRGDLCPCLAKISDNSVALSGFRQVAITLNPLLIYSLTSPRPIPVKKLILVFHLASF